MKVWISQRNTIAPSPAPAPMTSASTTTPQCASRKPVTTLAAPCWVRMVRSVGMAVVRDLRGGLASDTIALCNECPEVPSTG